MVSVDVKHHVYLLTLLLAGKKRVGVRVGWGGGEGGWGCDIIVSSLFAVGKVFVGTVRWEDKSLG